MSWVQNTAVTFCFWFLAFLKVRVSVFHPLCELALLFALAKLPFENFYSVSKPAFRLILLFWYALVSYTFGASFSLFKHIKIFILYLIILVSVGFADIISQFVSSSGSCFCLISSCWVIFICELIPTPNQHFQCKVFRSCTSWPHICVASGLQLGVLRGASSPNPHPH